MKFLIFNWSKLKKFLFKVLLRISLFNIFSISFILYLVLFLKILSLFIGVSFNSIEYIIKFYEIFFFSTFNILTLDLNNLIRGYYVDGIYVINPAGLVLFSLSFHLRNIFISKFKYKLYRLKSYILD